MLLQEKLEQHEFSVGSGTQKLRPCGKRGPCSTSAHWQKSHKDADYNDDTYLLPAAYLLFVNDRKLFALKCMPQDYCIRQNEDCIESDRR